MRKPVLWFALSGLYVGSTAGSPEAAELCVSCKGPDASYACIIDGADAVADESYKLFCISEIARSGKHESCAVARAVTPPCQGTRHVLKAPPGLTAFPGESEDGETAGGTSAESPPVGTQSGGNDGAQDRPAADAAPSPEEASEEKKSSEGTFIDKAGSAIGNAAQKSWKCLSTLFGDC